MKQLFLPEDYTSVLDVWQTEHAIKFIKDTFQLALAAELKLRRITAPIVVPSGKGLNDNLSGTEQPVSFGARVLGGQRAEIVQSLAKWKRYALWRHHIQPGMGIYTDMNALRPDETIDNIHSVYVDQWDWEKIITKDQRNVQTLQSVVKSVYDALRVTEKYMANKYDYIECILPEQIFFITSQELEDMYPDNTPKEREYKICKLHGAVFISQIGGKLASGEKHDGRAPDYDDWSLNGDILVYYPMTDIALELSSMGIRVDEDSLVSQLELAGCKERLELPFQKAVYEKKLPYTIGGGIGQSRICMFFLRKAHIGEVQSSLWPEDMIAQCEENGVQLL